MLRPVLFGHPHEDHQCPAAKNVKDWAVGLSLSSYLYGKKHMPTQTINHLWVGVLGHPGWSDQEGTKKQSCKQQTRQTYIRILLLRYLCIYTYNDICVYSLLTLEHTCHHIVICQKLDLLLTQRSGAKSRSAKAKADLAVAPHRIVVRSEIG